MQNIKTVEPNFLGLILSQVNLIHSKLTIIYWNFLTRFDTEFAELLFLENCPWVSHLTLPEFGILDKFGSEFENWDDGENLEPFDNLESWVNLALFAVAGLEFRGREGLYFEFAENIFDVWGEGCVLDTLEDCESLFIAVGLLVLFVVTCLSFVGGDGLCLEFVEKLFDEWGEGGILDNFGNCENLFIVVGLWVVNFCPDMGSICDLEDFGFLFFISSVGFAWVLLEIVFETLGLSTGLSFSLAALFGV